MGLASCGVIPLLRDRLCKLGAIMQTRFRKARNLGQGYDDRSRHKKRPIISDGSKFFNLVTLSGDKRLDQASRYKPSYIY